MANLAVGLAGSILMGSRAVSILSGVGTNLLVSTITTTTSSVCGIVRSISSSNQPGLEYVKAELEKIDLEHNVTVIQELIDEQKVAKDEEVKNSVKQALIGVNQILEKIHKELKTIQEAMNHHQTKYFNGWRSFNCKCSIKNIIKHKELLDTRYKMLVDLLKIYNQ